jgi:hypothetical protein
MYDSIIVVVLYKHLSDIYKSIPLGNSTAYLTMAQLSCSQAASTTSFRAVGLPPIWFHPRHSAPSNCPGSVPLSYNTWGTAAADADAVSKVFIIVTASNQLGL